MLSPKRVKHRKVMRGRMKGEAHRGNKVVYGEVRNSGYKPRMDNKQSDRGRSCRYDALHQERR